MSVEPTNFFIALSLSIQPNSQFFYETQTMVLRGYRNNQTVGVFASATLIMVYGGWNLMSEN